MQCERAEDAHPTLQPFPRQSLRVHPVIVEVNLNHNFPGHNIPPHERCKFRLPDTDLFQRDDTVFYENLFYLTDCLRETSRLPTQHSITYESLIEAVTTDVLPFNEID